MAMQAWLAVCSLSVLLLLPYNSLLVAQAYFDRHAFPGMEFPFASMLCYTAPLPLMQAILVFVGDRLAVKRSMRLSIAGYFVLSLCYVAIIVAGEFGVHRNVLFACALASCFALAFVNAVMQSTCLGIASAMGPEMTASAMIGLGVSGIITTILSFAAELALGTEALAKDQRAAAKQAYALFAFCAAYALACMWIFNVWLCRRIPEGREVIQVMEASRTPALEIQGAEEGGDGTSGVKSLWRRVAPVLRGVAPQAFLCWLSFGVSLSIFPGVMDRWIPQASSAFASTPDLFSRMLTSCFQVFDLVGRSMAGKALKCVSPRIVKSMTIARIAFIPLFMLGQRKPEACVLWGSDAGRFGLVAAMAASNGLCGSLTMIFGPSLVTAERRDLAGFAMSTSMTFGVFSGTVLAFATQIGYSERAGLEEAMRAPAHALLAGTLH